MKEKILKTVPGYEDKEIVIKKFNYGEKSALAGMSSSIKIIQGKEEVTVDAEKMRIFSLVYGIKSAPFFTMADLNHKENAVRQLDSDAGQYLFEEIQELNQPVVSEDLKKKLDLPQKDKK